MTKELKNVLVAAAIFLVLALIAGYFVNETLTEVNALTESNAALETQITELKVQAARLPDLQEELNRIKVNFAQFVRILPSPEIATHESLIQLVQEKADRAQFELQSYSPGRVPSTGRSRFQEVAINIVGRGTFEEFLQFLNALERHESFVRVNTFMCTPVPVTVAPGDESAVAALDLTVTLQISTFRYDSAAAGGGP